MDYSQLGNKRRRRRQNSQTTRVRNKISLLVLRVVLASMIVGVFAGIGIGLGAWLTVLANAPEVTASDIRPGNYASHIVCARTGEILETLHRGVNRTNVTLDEIPQHVIDAFLAIEDERFFYHNGIDIRGIGRAIWVLFRTAGDTTQGASTITQQLIKNRLERFDSDLTTKLQEQYLAVRFERELTELFGCNREAKEYILEVYLNTINLGRTNHGVQAAAQFYYGVDVGDLTIAQAATIAAITQNPTRFPPDTRPEANWSRAVLVLGNMRRLGFITDEEYYEAMNSNVYDTIAFNEDGQARATVTTWDCFTDALLIQLRDRLVDEKGITPHEADTIIFTTGLRIYTTQDLRKQAIVDEVLLDDSFFPTGPGRFEIYVTYEISFRNNITGRIFNHFPSATVNNMEEAIAFIYQQQYELLGANDEIIAENRIFTPQPQSAFVLMDHHNGHVLAIRGLRGEKAISRGHCRATIATRSPGSQLKPLIMAAGMDIGVLTLASTIDDVPWAIHPPGGNRWQPRNWWGGGHRGLSTVRAAIHTSKNVASARALVENVGIETGFQYMLNFGFTTLEGVTPAGRAWSDRIPALSLGGLTEGVILLELAAAYATIANDGWYNEPIFFSHVLNRDGSLLLDNNRPPRQVLRRETAYLLTNSMRDTLTAQGATGHGQRFECLQMRSDIQVAGKTGTSQLGRDSGFVGYTPYFTGAVWLGFDIPRTLPSNYTRYRETLWRTIMERVHEGLPPRSFERPSGIISASVCRDSGHPATELCRIDPRGSRVTTEIFASGTVPTTPCHMHVQHEICMFSGLIAGPTCHPFFVESQVGMMFEPLQAFAVGTSIPGRYLAFSQAVLEGQVCVNCESHYAELPGDDDPYGDYWDDESGNYGDFDWPWNIPAATPPPEDEYIPIPTPPPYDDYVPHDPPDEYVPIPTPEPPPADVPPEEPYVPEPEEHQDDDSW